MIEQGYISPKLLLYAGLITGLAVIAVCSGSGSLSGVIAVMLLPVALYYLIQTLRFPVVAFYGLFILNYFINYIIRYGQLSGFSVIMDVGLFGTLFIALTHSILSRKLPWENGRNILTAGCLLWSLYCLLEVANPTATFEAWSASRGIIYTGLLTAFLGSVLINRLKYVKQLVFILSILVLLAVLKTLIQKYIGFDSLEKVWLAQGGAKTHIIATGTRYFSFFTDAGNLGSNMGMAGVLYGIIAFYTPEKRYKIYYAIVASLNPRSHSRPVGRNATFRLDKQASQYDADDWSARHQHLHILRPYLHRPGQPHDTPHAYGFQSHGRRFVQRACRKQEEIGGISQKTSFR